MKSLPPDRATDRAETAAYLALGVAALVGVILAVPASVGFGNDIDPVTARLTREGSSTGLHFVATNESVGTNLAQGRVQSMPAEAIGPTNPTLAAPIAADQAQAKTAG